MTSATRWQSDSAPLTPVRGRTLDGPGAGSSAGEPPGQPLRDGGRDTGGRCRVGARVADAARRGKPSAWRARVNREASVSAPKIFISYRREETAAYAGRLYDTVAERFGQENVFMDLDLDPGIDFVERITQAVGTCHVLLVVMGPRWATVQDEGGEVRIADPEDYVRLEVETALRRPNVILIPVLVGAAGMPRREDLPDEIRAMTRRNALELSDARWRYDVGRLTTALDQLLAELTGTHVLPLPSEPSAPSLP